MVTFNDGQKMIVKNGHKGSDGKTAYQYAQDGGYVGTEEEFAEKLAQENPTKEKFEEEIGKLSKEISDLKESEHDIPMIINVTVTAEGQFVADKTFEEVFAVCKTVPCYVFADGLTLPLHNCSTDWCEFRYNKFHRGTYSIVTYTLCKVILNSDNSVEITMEEHELATGDDVYEINTRLYDLQYEVNNLKIPTVDDVLNELPTWQGGAY